MKRAIAEVERRREYQLKMNKKLGITPSSIEKPIREKLVKYEEETTFEKLFSKSEKAFSLLPDFNDDALTPMDRKKLIKKLQREMVIAAQDLNFEMAAEIRDKIKELNIGN